VVGGGWGGNFDTPLAVHITIIGLAVRWLNMFLLTLDVVLLTVLIIPVFGCCLL